MKKTFTKTIGLILCVFTVLTSFVFTACKKDGTGQPEDANYNSDMSQGINKKKVVCDLVTDGRSDYKIVIPQDADVCIEYAAEELQKYIQTSSDATLPIVKDNEINVSLSGKTISLGDTAFLEVSGINVEREKLNYDGFVMKTLANNVFIAGYRSSGVLYGVYDFCEQMLGVRFLATDYTYYTYDKTIKLYETDRTEIPAFANRDYYAYQSMTDKQFAIKLRLESCYGYLDPKFGEGGSNTYCVGEAHTTINQLLPDTVYRDAHPDWYVGTGWNSEICFTNGLTEDGKIDFNNENGLAKEMLNVCINKLTTHPTSRIVMIGQQDNGTWCDCKRCKKSDEENGGKSGTLMIFINAIAEELEKWAIENDRDVTVMTFAYHKTIAPPTYKDGQGNYVPINEKVIARDNVMVKFAWMGCFAHGIDDTSCTRNIGTMAQLDGWRAITSRFTIWDYATNFDAHFWWFENFDALVQDFKYYKKIGVEAITTQGAPHVANYYQGHLENYLVAKLSWNPYYNVNEIIEDFNAHYFGDSAEAVNEFVHLMRSHYKHLDLSAEAGFHTDLYSGGQYRDFVNYPIALLENAMNILKAEIDKTAESQKTYEEKEGLTNRLLQVYIQPMYMILQNYDAYYDPSGKLAFATEFFDYINRLDIRYYGEGLSISDLKSAYGVK